MTQDPKQAAVETPAPEVIEEKEIPEEVKPKDVPARDAANWAKQVSRLSVSDAPGDAVTPAEVITTWKQNFQTFWPDRNRFYGPLTGIAPGEVALLNLAMPGRLKLSTGVFVLYADDESFTFMTPQGHMFSGWITFSAFSADGKA